MMQLSRPLSPTSINLRTCKETLSHQPQLRFSGYLNPKLTEHKVNGITLGYWGPNSQPLPMSDELEGQPIAKGVSIRRWPVFTIQPRHIPVQTSGMCRCSALWIDSPRTNKQYLIHLSPDGSQEIPPTREQARQHFLHDIPGLLADEQTLPWLIPGINPFTSITVYAILQALHAINPALVEKTQFGHFPQEAARYGPNDGIKNPVGVLGYLGRLFCHPVAKTSPPLSPGGTPISSTVTVCSR